MAVLWNQKKMAPEIKQVLKMNQNQMFTVLPMVKGVEHRSWAHHWVPEKPFRSTALAGLEQRFTNEFQFYPSHCTQLRESLFPRRMWEERGSQASINVTRKVSQMQLHGREHGHWVQAPQDSNHGSTMYVIFGKLFYLSESPSIHTYIMEIITPAT